MLRRLTQVQLVIFILVTVASVTTMAIAYIGLPGMLGVGQYTIQVHLPETGGIYPQSNVTYRGSKIGTVRSVRLGAGNIVASVSIDDGVKVPANATVAVHSMSAIGEQYLDFTPVSEPAPPLEEGSVVPLEQVSMPVSTGELVDSVTGLLESVPRDSLRITVRELGSAFGGSHGDAAGRLIDASRQLQLEADRNRRQTLDLIENLQPVLTTQRRVAPDLRSLAPDLRRFSRTVRSSDDDLRDLLHDTPLLTAQVADVAEMLRPSLRAMSISLSGVSKVLAVYADSVGHLLQLMPAIVESHYSTLTRLSSHNDYATLNLAFKLGVNNPPFCTKGYPEAERQRDPSDLSEAPIPSTSYCDVPASDPRVVRGARNDPCPGRPARSPNAAGCKFNFDEDR